MVSVSVVKVWDRLALVIFLFLSSSFFSILAILYMRECISVFPLRGANVLKKGTYGDLLLSRISPWGLIQGSVTLMYVL